MIVQSTATTVDRYRAVTTWSAFDIIYVYGDVLKWRLASKQ